MAGPARLGRNRSRFPGKLLVLAFPLPGQKQPLSPRGAGGSCGLCRAGARPGCAVGPSPAVEVAAARKGGRKAGRRRALGQGRVEVQSSGLEAEACAGARFPKSGFTPSGAKRVPGPQTEAALGGEDEPCSSLGRERGAGADPAPARCFLVEHGWMWAEPSPLAPCRGPRSPPAPWSLACACAHGIGVGKLRCLS